jgi:uncharacterized protein YaeQ
MFRDTSLQEPTPVSPKSTIYHFSIELSDTDRGVYESFKVPTALHPSESLEFMVARVVAFALEYGEGISFSPGIGATEDPAISIKGLDGSVTAWIDVGAPNHDRIHRAAKIAERVAVYCHRSADVVYQQLTQSPIFRGDEVVFRSFDEGFISSLAKTLDRRNEVTISLSDETLYVQCNGHDLSSPLVERRLRANT